jgi:major histocompatibility complex class I
MIKLHRMKFPKGKFLRSELELGVVAHTFNPSTREAESGGFLSLRPDWSTE